MTNLFNKDKILHKTGINKISGFVKTMAIQKNKSAVVVRLL
jgi:hypothetical protein